VFNEKRLSCKQLYINHFYYKRCNRIKDKVIYITKKWHTIFSRTLCFAVFLTTSMYSNDSHVFCWSENCDWSIGCSWNIHYNFFAWYNTPLRLTYFLFYFCNFLKQGLKVDKLYLDTTNLISFFYQKVFQNLKNHNFLVWSASLVTL